MGVEDLVEDQPFLIHETLAAFCQAGRTRFAC